MENIIKEVAKYIIKNYSDSCIAQTLKINQITIDEWCTEDLTDSCRDFFKYELIGLCGCGSPESIEVKIRDLLRILKESRSITWEERKEQFNKSFGVSDIYDNELLAFMVYILNDKGILEHGSSIGGSWLTELGEVYFDLLSQINFELN